MNCVRLVDGEELEIPAFTLDVARHPVNLSSEVWQLNSATSNKTRLDWNALLGWNQVAVAALKHHIIRLIETNSTAHVHNTFGFIGKFLIELREAKRALGGSISLTDLLWYLEKLRAKSNGYQFHHIRQWYTASADRLIDEFSDDIVFALEDLRVEGNAKGFAVLSADPEHGPLSELEVIALRQALIRDKGPIIERAALWLAFALGSNPANLALLRENDFSAFHFPDNIESAYLLEVPRIKKRQTLELTRFDRQVV